MGSPSFSTVNYPPISNGSTETPSFLARFIVNRGEGLSPSWLLLSSWRPRRCSAPLSSSSRGCVSPPAGQEGREPEPRVPDRVPHGSPTYPFLDELEGPLVLGDLEQLHGASLVRGEATHLPDHVPHELGVFGETLREAGESAVCRRRKPRPPHPPISSAPKQRVTPGPPRAVPGHRTLSSCTQTGHRGVGAA